MEKRITGPGYVLGDNIDTDQIIPAEHLVLNPAVAAERKRFGRFALIGVPAAGAGLPGGSVPFVDQTDPENSRSRFRIIVGGRNFGCGSSREHAPLALAEAGVTAVVAESYARIFFRNSVNGGYVIPYETPVRLVGEIRTGDELDLSVEENRLFNRTTGKEYALRDLGDVGPIIAAGGLFKFARASGMLKPNAAHAV
jgi:3-isopropylmalate/(R)-2-methylmalate dehydratase small subunit